MFKKPILISIAPDPPLRRSRIPRATKPTTTPIHVTSNAMVKTSTKIDRPTYSFMVFMNG